jgi:hypothetical protein
LFYIFSGNAAKYCDYIFTAADKDKNGRISFCELMSIVALTSTGNSNVEKRLRLVSGRKRQNLVGFMPDFFVLDI